MANVLYSLGREAFLTGNISWSADDVRACLVKSTYTFSDSHQYMSDIGTNDNGRSAALSGKTTTNGTADASDTSLTATAATACNALVVFKHTGVDGTARLIAYIDTPTSGLPMTPAAGQTVNITWDNGANKIFTL